MFDSDFFVKNFCSSAYSASTQKRDTAPIFWSVKSASVLIVISNFILSSSPSLSSSPEPSSRQRASAWSAVRTVYKPENPGLQRRIIVRQEIQKQRYAEEG